MFNMAGVSEEDQLDREAAQQVMRRAWRTLAPYRRPLRWALFLVVVYTLCALAGPYLVKVGIDRGIRRHDALALNLAVGGFLFVALLSFVVNGVQVMMVGRVGEGFLRDLRVRVFDHLQTLSMPFYDREKAGVIVSRMTSDVDSLQDLVQQGLLQFVSSVLLILFSVVVLTVVSWQLTLVCLIPAAVRDRGEREVPARLEPGLPHDPRPDRHRALVAAGGDQRCPGDPGVRPGGCGDRAVR